MKARFSSFKYIKEVARCDGHHTTRVTLDVPHRMMLSNLSISDICNIKAQCEYLLAHSQMSDRTIYLGTLECVEEVENDEINTETTS